MLVTLFVLLALAVAHRGRTPVDTLLYAGQPDIDAALERPGVVALLMARRLLLGWTALLTVVSLLLVSPFFSSRRNLIAQLFMGPIPDLKITRIQALMYSEIMIGVLAALWLCHFVPPLVHRDGPGVSISFPALDVAAAIGFWGSAASLSHKFEAKRAVSLFLIALFAIALPLSVFVTLYLSQGWPTDLIGGLLLGACILCAAHGAADRLPVPVTASDDAA